MEHLKQKRSRHDKQGVWDPATWADHENTVGRTSNGKVDWNKTRAVEDLTDNELAKIKRRKKYAKSILKDHGAPWTRIREHAIANYETTRGTIKWKKLAKDKKSARVTTLFPPRQTSNNQRL